MNFRRTLPELMQQVRERRQKIGVTQQDVAVAAGIAVQYYCELERGRFENTTIRTLQNIDNALTKLERASAKKVK